MTQTQANIASLEVGLIVKKARQFIAKFGIDDSQYSDDEVLEKVQKIQNIQANPVNVQVLSRGVANEQIQLALSKVPRGYVGQFILNTETAIFRARALGWEVFLDEEASKQSPTGSADRSVILADCILVFIPEEKYIAARLGEEARLQHVREKRNPKKEAEAASKEEGLLPILNLR